MLSHSLTTFCMSKFCYHDCGWLTIRKLQCIWPVVIRLLGNQTTWDKVILKENYKYLIDWFCNYLIVNLTQIRMMGEILSLRWIFNPFNRKDTIWIWRCRKGFKITRWGKEGRKLEALCLEIGNLYITRVAINVLLP